MSTSRGGAPSTGGGMLLSEIASTGSYLQLRRNLIKLLTRFYSLLSDDSRSEILL